MGGASDHIATGKHSQGQTISENFERKKKRKGKKSRSVHSHRCQRSLNHNKMKRRKGGKR